MTIKEFFSVKRSRREVAEFFGCSDRDARRKIAQLQRDYNIINLQDGKGYFIADGAELKRYAVQEYKRACEIMKKARTLLKRADVDEAQIVLEGWDDEDE